MKIAVEGCAHGELEKIYDTIQGIEKTQNIKIDLLLCCGDFQSTRNLEDLQTMAVPKKYQDICTFYKYYSGERVAPMLTIFIGGNHEASNYLQELPYGGWVAPNIYYLGYAGVVRVNGIRIGGISGIYKGHDFLRGRYEFSPYTEATQKSVYHVRHLEVFRLKQLSGLVDIFMSHDWPRGIYNYGNKDQLVRFKPHFRDEVDSDQLGSRPCEDLLKTLQPSLWFAAHLHCKFAAVVPHVDEGVDAVEGKERVTKFLALDKCLPKRRFLQVLDIDSVDHVDEGNLQFEYDAEWLAILYLTNHLISVKSTYSYMPGPKSGMTEERTNFTPSTEELQYVRQKFGGDLKIPENFCRTVEPYNPSSEINSTNMSQPKAQINPQSMHFCDTLGIDDPLSLAMLISGHELSHSSTLNGSDAVLNDSSSSLLLGDQSLTSLNSSDALSALQPSPLKRKSSLGMSLPKPSSASAAGNSPQATLVSPEKVDTSMNPDELELADSSADETEKSQEDNNVQVADQNVSVQAAEDEPRPTEALNAKPPIKKFKRRNQDIYKEDSDENNET